MRKLRLLAATLFLVGSVSAGAFQLVLLARPTGIESSTPRLISYRHQERFWITDDGARHLIANLGAQGGGMHLMVRARDGSNWQPAFSLPNTGDTSTADSLLVRNELHIVLADTQHDLVYAKATYDPTIGAWSLSTTEVIAPTYTDRAAPTLAVDTKSDLIWCAAQVLDQSSGVYQLQAYYRKLTGGEWLASPQRWGSPNLTPSKAARLLSLSDRIGMLYTDMVDGPAYAASLNWSTLPSISPPSDHWTSQVVFPAGGREKDDSVGTHFSASVDELDNINVSWTDMGILRHFRYAGATQRWNAGIIYSIPAMKSIYSQVAQDRQRRVYLVYNVASFVFVRRSNNRGLTFQPFAFLVAAPGKPLDSVFPRVETPAVIHRPMDVLQQAQVAVDRGVYLQVLYEFQLDLREQEAGEGDDL